jgi:hypothetical protein
MITKITLPLLAAMLSVACVLTGCQSPKAGSPSGSSAAQATRNNSYSLLHQLTTVRSAPEREHRRTGQPRTAIHQLSV